ncbi:uncharacterized protein LOC129913045 isoform X2 [Episyrphus balteatus]|nr:uncharacterized protein LOC129913045 isoform X2 [Episyrphus balteatus]
MQQPSQLQQIARDTQSASSTSLSSVGGGGADGGGGGGRNDGGGTGNGQSTEKNMYSMKHHLNQIAQQQNHQNQALDHESPSPHHYARRSAEASPVPAINDHAGVTAAAAMASSHISGGLRPLSMSIPKIETSTPTSENGPSSGGGNKTGVMGGVGISGSSVIGSEKMKRSPSIERREFDITKDRVKLHCIVESVHSSQASLANDTRNAYKRRPNIESDCCVDVGTATLWKDIVNTALQNLGYSLEVASTARGSLVIKNWKPIPLENISDNPVVQVGDILGELASVITLRILILRAKSSPFGEIKDKLLRLLVLQSHAVLRSTGCPLDEVILSQICRSSYQSSYDYTGEISDDLRRKFDQWWSNQLSPQSPIAPKMLPFMAAAAAAGAPHQPSGMDFSTVGQMAAAAAAARSLQQHHSSSRDNLLGDSHQPPPPPPHHLHPSMIVHPVMHPHPMHPHHASYPTNQKTRMRTSFDPEMELPKLQKWFQENPHPSRQQIQTYVMQLNSLESRRGRKPLDVNNVVYWFKNARAAQKRAEMRGGVGQMPGAGIGGAGAGHSANGYLNHHAQQLMSHDYLKSPMSLKSEDIDTMSQHSDDMDDDQQSRPISPQLPLSLTMHERNRSPEDERSSLGKEDATSNHNGSSSVERNSHSVDGGNNEDLPNGNTDRHSDVETHLQHGEANNNNTDSSNNNNNSHNNINSSNRSLDERCESPKNSPKSDEDLDMDDDDNDTSQMEGFGTPSPDPRKDIFSMVPNAMFPQSLMYMSHYMPAFGQPGHPHHGGAGMHPSVPMGTGSLNLSNLSSEERRKRNRTFIDPVTEVPKLEHWFSLQTHPSHNMILKYTEDLNTMPYRQKFPRLESKNVQFWFKNRRAKCKRLKMSLYDSPQCGQLGGMNSFVHKYDERD